MRAGPNGNKTKLVDEREGRTFIGPVHYRHQKSVPPVLDQLFRLAISSREVFSSGLLKRVRLCSVVRTCSDVYIKSFWKFQ